MKTTGLLVAAILLTISPTVARADFILNCRSAAEAYIEWNEKSKSLVAEKHQTKSDTSATITIAVVGGSAFLKGNLGETPLTMLSQRALIETTLTGNIVLYTILPARAGVPAIVVQHKAYDLGAPFATTVAYKCG